MKLPMLPLLFLVTVASAPLARAGQGADWPDESLLTSHNLGRLSVAAAFAHEHRNVREPDGVEYMARARTYYGTAALDLFRWITVFGGAGQSELKPARYSAYGDGDDMWTAGVRATLWQYRLTDPAMLDSLCRLNAAYSYWDSSASIENGEAEWDEERTAVTLSAEIPAQRWHEIDSLMPYPESLVLYVGWVHSRLTGDLTFPDDPAQPEIPFEAVTTSGLICGAEVMISAGFSAGLEWRALGDSSYTAHLALHF